MGTNRKLRAPGAATLAAGALIIPATAVALTSGTANAQPSQAPLRVDGIRHHLRYGTTVTVRGQLPAADAGQRVALEYEPAASTTWRPLATTTVSRRGRFTLHARMLRSGLVRVADVSARAATAAASVRGAASGPIPPSQPAPVGVAAGFRISNAARGTVTGHSVTVRGRLLPGTGGRVVRLIARSGNGWQTLARARTGRHGRFVLHYTARPGTRWLRVAFRGDQVNRGTWAPAGSVSGLMYRVASWYNDGGQTGCGFHAYYGVANKSLPCGTQVTIAYGGRTVVATVDDRGPYVAGRTYDLNQNVAAALGMYGVATVLASR